MFEAGLGAQECVHAFGEKRKLALIKVCVRFLTIF